MTTPVTRHCIRPDRLVITLSLWREEHLLSHPEDAGAVFTVEIPAKEFVGILEGIAAALDPS
ncbi:hypothetical protein [Streptomyces sp. NPDC000133]|uniref:hypothetical protein n=1 Tax=Streptomyces sp. NPDC000133 TaxID=3364535 RepID=UPI0036804250